MSDQFVMNQDGELEPDQPRSWDGEPLYCPDTVREGLFDPSAFEQMPGQLPFDGESFDQWRHRKYAERDQLMGEAWSGPGGFWENRERNL